MDDTEYLGQEYLVSFSKGSQYSEMFMFDNENTIKQRKSSEILEKEMDNFRGSVSNITSDHGKIYYIFAFRNSDGFAFKKVRFRNPDFEFRPTEEKYASKPGSFGGQVSCFSLEESKYTICGYKILILILIHISVI